MRSPRLARYEEKLLLGGRWLPVTQTVLFYRAEVDRCVDVISRRQAPASLRRFGALPRQREVHGDGLEALLHRMLPLRPVEPDKWLFVATRNPEWTAVFTDQVNGVDLSGTPPVTEWGIEEAAVRDSPRGMRPTGWWAPVGSRLFSVGMPCAPWVNSAGHTVSSVGGYATVRVSEGRRWEFELQWSRGGPAAVRDGFPGPVGLVWDESAPRTPDRLTHDHLRLAGERLGLFPFDEDFYAPDGRGVILERSDPGAARLPGYTLGQARGEEPRDR